MKHVVHTYLHTYIKCIIKWPWLQDDPLNVPGDTNAKPDTEPLKLKFKAPKEWKKKEKLRRKREKEGEEEEVNVKKRKKDQPVTYNEDNDYDEDDNVGYDNVHDDDYDPGSDIKADYDNVDDDNDYKVHKTEEDDDAYYGHDEEIRTNGKIRTNAKKVGIIYYEKN